MNFIPDWPVLLQFTGAAIVLTLIPGPDIALFISRSITQGRSASFACLIGAYTGIVLHVLLVTVGLSALIVASPTGFFILKCVGAAYLLWLAFQAIRSRSAFAIPTRPAPKATFQTNYITGLMCNLLNPKVVLFNITFLPQFILASDPHASGKLFFLGLSFIPISLPFTVFSILAADKLAIKLKNEPILIRLLEGLMAAVFIAFAIQLLFKIG